MEAWIGRALWIASAVVAVGTIARLHASARVNHTGHQPLGVAPARVARPSAESLAQAVEIVSDNNLFRATREPPETEHMTFPATETFAALPSPKPHLVLRGVLGPPYVALLDGMPGAQGTTVVRPGETIAGITVSAVRRDTVILRGSDTTWTVTLGNSW